MPNEEITPLSGQGERQVAPALPSPALPRKRHRRRRVVLALVAPLLLLMGIASLSDVEYAYVPAPGDTLNSDAYPAPAFNVWERDVSQAEAVQLLRTDAGRHFLSARNGAVTVTPDSMRLGRQAFYAQTFGNEVFLTDVMGLLNGPIRPLSFAIGIAAVAGRGTTNLRVPLMSDANIGGHLFHRGEWVSTGIDVPRGVWVPLGMKLRWKRGHILGGITCAACHSTVDLATGKVIDGAPNPDFVPGLVMTLASNSAAFFPHASLDAWKSAADSPISVRTTNGAQVFLPDPVALEQAVDKIMLGWPPGNFDSTVDLIANPSQIPVSWTRENYPYSWSGPFGIGPFRGLSAQDNNVHALNADSLVQADQSLPMFGVDREVYLATILQNAASPRFRWTPAQGTPSAFFARVDPTPYGPGLNTIIASPVFPRATYLTPDSSFVSTPGRPFWQENHAMAAWQDALIPPPPAQPLLDVSVLAQGRRVFARAGCIRCHSGAFGSNHRVLPYHLIGGEDTRAKAFARTVRSFAPPVLYAADAPVPPPPGTPVLTAPFRPTTEADMQRAWAHGEPEGGYKVPALTGLWWTAPYLHDGGVGVCANSEIPCRAYAPVASLRALIDRNSRASVVAANRADKVKHTQHIRGDGHAFWADAGAGFTTQEEDALITYLLYGFGTPGQSEKF